MLRMLYHHTRSVPACPTSPHFVRPFRPSMILLLTRRSHNELDTGGTLSRVRAYPRSRSGLVVRVIETKHIQNVHMRDVTNWGTVSRLVAATAWRHTISRHTAHCAVCRDCVSAARIGRGQQGGGPPVGCNCAPKCAERSTHLQRGRCAARTAAARPRGVAG